MRPARHFVGYALGFLGYLVIAAPHEALDRIDRVFRIRYRLALGYLPHQALSRLGDGHHRGRRPGALLVWYHHGLAALHHGDD